jgi:hypothetical protein
MVPMGGDVVGCLQLTRPRSHEPEAAPESLALVLSQILHQPVAADDVRRKAVGLGLLRLPQPGEGKRLAPQAISRLLLAGYQLPALAEQGTLRVLRSHWREGRRVFVLLDGTGGEDDLPSVLQVCGFEHEGSGMPWLLVIEPRPEGIVPQRLPIDEFLEVWSAAGKVVIVAARQWSDLPTVGLVFFGGLRDKDGSYHWNSAECDTDREGRILRY